MSKNVAVFVDVANIFYAAKAAGVDIDYVTLLKSATAGRDFVRAYAYTGLDPDNENQRNFHQFLARNNYKVVSKDIRKYGDGRVKANLDIEMVVDMMKTARNLDVAVLVSGDGDFAPAIRAVQEMGVRVEVICFKANTSSDLIDVADQFIEITQVAKVEKGSGRSGRRVAGDEEDLSMTEVPEKQTEGATERRRRTRAQSAEASGSRSRSSRSSTRSTTATTSTSSRRGSVTAMPGEKLSRATEAAPDEPEAAVEDEDLEATAADGPAETDGEETADGQRRRRRRRGRGRGRGRETTGDAEALDDEAPLEDMPAPRAPRAATFGSVWDSQIGTPSGPRSTSRSEDEDLDEPEVPEYLLAERRGGGNRRDGRGGGGRRDAYRSAIDRERYGRGGGRGPAPRSGPRESYDAPRDQRPQRRSPEGWSEVPPELEAMLRAQMSTKEPVSAGARSTKPEATAAPDVVEEAAKPARRSSRSKAAADAPATAGADDGAAAKPARRSRAKAATAADDGAAAKPARRSRAKATTEPGDGAEPAAKPARRSRTKAEPTA